MTLPADIARCHGVGFEDSGGFDWRDGCKDCMRRLSIPADHDSVQYIDPTPIIAFECEHLIEPGETP